MFPNFNKSSAVAEMGDRVHNRHGPKRWGLLCPFRADLGPRLIQCGLDQGLLPYQVASSSIQLFGHNKRAKNWVVVGVPSVPGVAGSPLNTKSPGPRLCHLSPSSRLTTTDIGRKLGDYAPLAEGKLGPH